MPEEDYLSFQPSAISSQQKQKDLKLTANFSSQIMKQTILPVIEQEVNSGKNFANLRQVYSSLILALWFKKKLKQSLESIPSPLRGGLGRGNNPLTQLYFDQKKIKGIENNDPDIKEKVYRQYLQSFSDAIRIPTFFKLSDAAEFLPRINTAKPAIST